SSQVGNPGTHSIIEVESVHWLKSRDVQQRFAGIEATFVLGERVCPRQDGWDTSHPKLAGDVALAAPEVEGSAGGGPKDRTQPPPSQHRIHKGIGLDQPALALANRMVVHQRQHQSLRY